MAIGLKSRVFIGFLVILVTFAGTSLFAVSRMQRIREDLRLIHKGYLNMTRLATQVRTLQEAKDEYVQRALTETDLDVRRYLVGYARTFYPKVLRDRLREIEVLAEGLERSATLEGDRRYLSNVLEQVRRAEELHDAYDEATGALLGQLDTEDPAIIEGLLEAYRGKSDALGHETQSLSIRMEAKLDEAVLRAERSERDAGFAVIVLSLVALVVSAAVMLGINRGLRPLGVLLESARAIARGSLDVRVDIGTDDEVGALATEFNSMARALKDREQVLASQNLDLGRLKAFSDDVIRSVRVGIVVLDEEGRVRVLNPAARSVFALPLVDVEGRALSEVANLPGPLLDALSHLEEVRETSREQSFELLPLGERVVDVALIPRRDRAGAAAGDVLLIGEDVTAREETRARLLESERLAAIGRLAAQITHEIRNPLSSIGLNMELLGDDLPYLPEERRDEAKSILDAVASEVDRLTQITEGYLRYARLPAKGRALGDVGDLLADLCAFSQGEANQMGVMLELQVESDLPEVSHDAPRLRQALLNLLRNAEEAAGRGGTVRLSARAGADAVELRVEDSGPGIKAEDRVHIFEPFFTTKASGTGLGLTLTREIVREHGGELRLDDTSLGGAAFVISLPTGPERPVDAAA